MNVYSIFQRTQARNIPSSLSLLFKGLSELRSGRQPARLIDPVVNLPVTGLFVNRSIHHVLNRTKPSLHPPLSRRNPIKCCEPYAPRFFSSTSFFMFFSFFPNPLIPLAPMRIFLRSFAYPPCGSEWSNDDKHEQRNRKAGTAGWSGGLATHPALSAPLPPGASAIRCTRSVRRASEDRKGLPSWHAAPVACG